MSALMFRLLYRNLNSGKKHFFSALFCSEYCGCFHMQFRLPSRQDKWESRCFSCSCPFEPDPNLTDTSWKIAQYDLRENCLCPCFKSAHCFWMPRLFTLESFASL